MSKAPENRSALELLVPSHSWDGGRKTRKISFHQVLPSWGPIQRLFGSSSSRIPPMPYGSIPKSGEPARTPPLACLGAATSLKNYHTAETAWLGRVSSLVNPTIYCLLPLSATKSWSSSLSPVPDVCCLGSWWSFPKWGSADVIVFWLLLGPSRFHLISINKNNKEIVPTNKEGNIKEQKGSRKKYNKSLISSRKKQNSNSPIQILFWKYFINKHLCLCLLIPLQFNSHWDRGTFIVNVSVSLETHFFLNQLKPLGTSKSSSKDFHKLTVPCHITWQWALELRTVLNKAASL